MIKKYSDLKKYVNPANAKLSLKVGQYEVEAQLSLDEELDPNYGEDADGNRGHPETLYYGWEFAENPLITTEDSESYIPFESLPKADQDMIKREIEKNIGSAEKYD